MTPTTTTPTTTTTTTPSTTTSIRTSTGTSTNTGTSTRIGTGTSTSTSTRICTCTRTSTSTSSSTTTSTTSSTTTSTNTGRSTGINTRICTSTGNLTIFRRTCCHFSWPSLPLVAACLLALLLPAGTTGRETGRGLTCFFRSLCDSRKGSAIGPSFGSRSFEPHFVPRSFVISGTRSGSGITIISHRRAHFIREGPDDRLSAGVSVEIGGCCLVRS